jgi:hypothetical protein
VSSRGDLLGCPQQVSIREVAGSQEEGGGDSVSPAQVESDARGGQEGRRLGRQQEMQEGSSLHTMGKHKTAIVLHLDSLVECAELLGMESPERIHAVGDPCYTRVMDRFLAIFADYDVTPSIYLIGRHLEQPYVAAAVQSWRDRGCELGNHTWSHWNDFGWLDAIELELEVRRSHDLIASVTGRIPIGFVAPSWSHSNRASGVLESLHYEYDLSFAPTWILDLSQLALWLKSPGRRNRIPPLRPDLRARWSGHGGFSLRPSSDPPGLVEAPLPLGWARTGFFHTLFFLLPDPLANKVFESAYANNRYFYYTLHPLDLIDPATDLKRFDSRLAASVRASVPLDRKERLLRRSLERMSEDSEFVTMEQLVAEFRSRPGS